MPGSEPAPQDTPVVLLGLLGVFFLLLGGAAALVGILPLSTSSRSSTGSGRFCCSCSR